MDRIEKILVFVVVATIVVIVTIALTTGGPGNETGDPDEAAKTANRGVGGGETAVGGPTGGTDAGTADGGAGYGDPAAGAGKGTGLEGDRADLDSPIVRPDGPNGGAENALGSNGRAAAGGGGRPTNLPSTPGIPSERIPSDRDDGVSGRSGSEGSVPNAPTARRGSGIGNDPAPVGASGLSGRVASNQTPSWLSDDAPSDAAVRYVQVRKDDSYWRIAERVYGDGKYFKKLVEANLDVPPTRMRPGVTIIVPPFEPKAKATIAPTLVTGKPTKAAPEAPKSARGVRVVRLSRGQTVYGLLRENKMERKFREVLALNGLTEAQATDLAVGHPIKLPVR